MFFIYIIYAFFHDSSSRSEAFSKSIQKVFFKISQNSQENTCVGVFILIFN